MKLLKVLSTALIVLWLVSPLSAVDLDVKVTPQVVQMGAFYNGTRVRIEFLGEPDAKPVLIIRGSEAKEVFNLKGRAGPIWVNTGKVSISGVPSLYLAISPQAVNEFLQPEAIEKYQLDLAALKKQIRIEPQEMDRDIIRVNYLQLKTEESSYRFVSNAPLTMGEPGVDGVLYGIDFEWPKKAPPGKYEVVVYESRNGSVVRERHAPLEAARVGFPALMASLASSRAGLYGLMAVILAMLAGFGMDSLVAALRRKRKPAPAPGSAGAASPHRKHSPVPSH
jgi:hypothetical protein